MKNSFNLTYLVFSVLVLFEFRKYSITLVSDYIGIMKTSFPHPKFEFILYKFSFMDYDTYILLYSFCIGIHITYLLSIGNDKNEIFSRHIILKDYTGL